MSVNSEKKRVEKNRMRIAEIKANARCRAGVTDPSCYLDDGISFSSKWADLNAEEELLNQITEAMDIVGPLLRKN